MSSGTTIPLFYTSGTVRKLLSKAWRCNQLVLSGSYWVYRPLRQLYLERVCRDVSKLRIQIAPPTIHYPQIWKSLVSLMDPPLSVSHWWVQLLLQSFSGCWTQWLSCEAGSWILFWRAAFLFSKTYPEIVSTFCAHDTFAFFLFPCWFFFQIAKLLPVIRTKRNSFVIHHYFCNRHHTGFVLICQQQTSLWYQRVYKRLYTCTS